MVTPEEFKQAQDTVRCIIETIFHCKYEKVFLEHFNIVPEEDLNPTEVERCHMSGGTFRVTLKHDDGREHDVYLSSDDVYHWYSDLAKSCEEK